MRKNKKGSTVDNFYILVAFFSLAIFGLTALIFWNALTDTQMNEQIWDQTSVGTTARNSAQNVFDNLDGLFTLVYIGLHIGVIALAFFLRNHPVVFVVVILLTAILVMVAVPLSNAYEDILTDSDFIGVSTSMPKVNYIMQNFPLMEMLWGVLTGVVLVASGRVD